VLNRSEPATDFPIRQYADQATIQRAMDRDAITRASGAVREINLRLGSSKANGVDVQLVERSGKLHVAVRTPDADLASSLRDNLGSLLSRMGNQGYRAETWTPAGGGQSLMSHRNSGAGSTAQFGDSPHGGNSSSGDQANDGRQHRQDRPAWLEELETSVGGTPKPGMEGMEWIQLLRH
jgi:hypothetical protein